MLGAREIAEDPEMVNKLTEFYWEIERGSGAVPVLLPWLPTPSKKKVPTPPLGDELLRLLTFAADIGCSVKRRRWACI
jgi:hypothetical protein